MADTKKAIIKLFSSFRFEAEPRRENNKQSYSYGWRILILIVHLNSFDFLWVTLRYPQRPHTLYLHCMIENTDDPPKGDKGALAKICKST